MTANSVIPLAMVMGLLGAVAAACGNPKPVARANPGADPVACMESQGVTGIREVGAEPETWEGAAHAINGDDLFIDVTRYATIGEASAARAAADLVYTAQADRFVVVGPARSGSPGATLDIVDGEIASFAVTGVAACLRG